MTKTSQSLKYLSYKFLKAIRKNFRFVVACISGLVLQINKGYNFKAMKIKRKYKEVSEENKLTTYRKQWYRLNTKNSFHTINNN